MEDQYVSATQIQDEIKLLDLDGLIAFIMDAANYEGSLKLMDLTQSLIFVIGNLDEAYYMSRNINPDISADEFHHYTLKITVADVKKALQRRFRNEQIARLGNNHICILHLPLRIFGISFRLSWHGLKTLPKSSLGSNWCR